MCPSRDDGANPAPNGPIMVWMREDDKVGTIARNEHARWPTHWHVVFRKNVKIGAVLGDGSEVRGSPESGEWYASSLKERTMVASRLKSLSHVLEERARKFE